MPLENSIVVVVVVVVVVVEGQGGTLP